MVSLVATASDPDGDRLTYRWTGQGGSFANARARNTTWTAPAAELTEKTYQLTLKVRDIRGASRSASVPFTVRKLPTPSKPEIHKGSPGSQRGWIAMDWDSTDNTNRYKVLQLKNGSYTELSSPSEVSIDFEESTAVVVGLDPDDEQIYYFKVRASNNHASTLSDPFEVHIRPPPQNLTGEYNIGEYEKITLTWKPVPNPDVGDDLDHEYHVEQYFSASDWQRLTTTPLDGVTIGSIDSVGDSVTVVVSGLEPGEEYMHRVKAQSVQGLSEPSNVATTTVEDERPGIPGSLKVTYMLGFKGIKFEWAKVPEAKSYMVRATPDTDHVTFEATGSDKISVTAGSPWVGVSPGDDPINILGLVSGTFYTFSVRGLTMRASALRPRPQRTSHFRLVTGGGIRPITTSSTWRDR